MHPHKAHLSYDVPYADTDRMGMVYYANYLVFFERTRTQLLKEAGYPYPEMEADGFGLPVIEAHVEYSAPATYGDTLDLYGWSEWSKAARLRVDCEVYLESKRLAKGYTVHACISLKTGRPTALPERLRNLYANGVLNCAPQPGNC